MKRGKRYDYFTSCLPFPQKGPSVTLPLGTSAPVALNPDITYPTNNAVIRNTTTGAVQASVTSFQTDGAGQWVSSPGPQGVFYQPGVDHWVADLSDATSATINALREAFQIQKLLERDARGGTRYTEIIRSHFELS